MHGNGDTANQEDENVVKSFTVNELEACVEDEGFGDNEDMDGYET